MNLKRHYIFASITMAIMLGAIAIMVVHLLPLFKEIIVNAADESNMVDYISSYGLRGVPVLICLQALQVITAVVPSAAIQVLTGLCYGVWFGVLINIAGGVLGNVLVFTSLRQMKKLLAPFWKKDDEEGDSEEVLNTKKLSHIKKPEMVVFLFFLIPGIPNGIVPYVFAKTNISLKKYISAVVAGSIPSTFICVFVGERLSKGNYVTVIVMATVVTLIAAVVLLFKNKIIDKITREDCDEVSEK